MILLALLPGQGWSQEAVYVEQVRANLQQMDAVDQDENWYFIITAQLDNELLVTESDPTRVPLDRRRLRSVNGEPPTAARQLAFREQEKKRVEDAEIQQDTLKYSYMVDAQTLSLLEKNGSLVTLSFTPNIQAFASDRANLAGTVVLNADTGMVEKITMKNTGELAPAFSVTIDNYEMVLSFLPQQGTLLVSDMITRLEGSYGFVKSFDSESVISFGDYRLHQ